MRKKIPFPGTKSDLRAWNHISLKLIKSNKKKKSALTMITSGETDVDGNCGSWTEVVSHATPPHLVKVKINFDEVQKLTWKE